SGAWWITYGRAWRRAGTGRSSRPRSGGSGVAVRGPRGSGPRTGRGSTCPMWPRCSSSRPSPSPECSAPAKWLDRSDHGKLTGHRERGHALGGGLVDDEQVTQAGHVEHQRQDPVHAREAQRSADAEDVRATVQQRLETRGVAEPQRGRIDHHSRAALADELLDDTADHIPGRDVELACQRDHGDRLVLADRNLEWRSHIRAFIRFGASCRERRYSKRGHVPVMPRGRNDGTLAANLTFPL